MAIKKTLSVDGNEMTIKPAGRFDVNLYAEFSMIYQGQMDSVSKYIIDMSEVEFIDSSALGMMLMLREQAGGDEADIQIVSCSPAVKKILTTAKFERLFKIG
ncbi:MAG: STAS domain-containing protein [Deltaproteobacteria bacterium]|nr:STAS domain-containing protein [Deltaproteobacteria bacterium]